MILLGQQGFKFIASGFGDDHLNYYGYTNSLSTAKDECNSHNGANGFSFPPNEVDSRLLIRFLKSPKGHYSAERSGSYL